MIATGRFYGKVINTLYTNGVVKCITVEDQNKRNEIMFDEVPNGNGEYTGRLTKGDSVFVLTDEFTAREECELNIVFVKVSVEENGIMVRRPAALIELVSGVLILKENDVVYSINDWGDCETLTVAEQKKLSWWQVGGNCGIEASLIDMIKFQYNIADKGSKVIAQYANNLGFNVKVYTYVDREGSVCRSIRTMDYLDLSCGKVAFVKFDKKIEEEEFDTEFYEDFEDDEEEEEAFDVEDDDEDFYEDYAPVTNKRRSSDEE